MRTYPAKKSYYGSTAARYDEERFTSIKGRWLDRREKHSVTRALQHVERDSTILDLPCGTGRITQHLLTLGYHVAGGDISTDMIAIARKRIGDHDRLLGYHELDAEKIALPTNSYDCLTSVRLMGHLPPTMKITVLREMARVARNYLVVTFYEAGLARSLKWRLTRRSSMSRASWYPVRRTALPSLFRECALTPVARRAVYPLLSDGVTYLLRVPSP